jgi:hypothetical protein
MDGDYDLTAIWNGCSVLVDSRRQHLLKAAAERARNSSKRRANSRGKGAIARSGAPALDPAALASSPALQSSGRPPRDRSPPAAVAPPGASRRQTPPAGRSSSQSSPSKSFHEVEQTIQQQQQLLQQETTPDVTVKDVPIVSPQLSRRGTSAKGYPEEDPLTVLSTSRLPEAADNSEAEQSQGGVAATTTRSAAEVRPSLSLDVGPNPKTARFDTSANLSQRKSTSTQQKQQLQPHPQQQQQQEPTSPLPKDSAAKFSNWMPFSTWTLTFRDQALEDLYLASGSTRFWEASILGSVLVTTFVILGFLLDFSTGFSRYCFGVAVLVSCSLLSIPTAWLFLSEKLEATLRVQLYEGALMFQLLMLYISTWVLRAPVVDACVSSLSHTACQRALDPVLISQIAILVFFRIRFRFYFPCGLMLIIGCIGGSFAKDEPFSTPLLDSVFCAIYFLFFVVVGLIQYQLEYQNRRAFALEARVVVAYLMYQQQTEAMSNLTSALFQNYGDFQPISPYEAKFKPENAVITYAVLDLVSGGDWASDQFDGSMKSTSDFAATGSIICVALDKLLSRPQFQDSIQKVRVCGDGYHVISGLKRPVASSGNSGATRSLNTLADNATRFAIDMCHFALQAVRAADDNCRGRGRLLSNGRVAISSGDCTLMLTATPTLTYPLKVDTSGSAVIAVNDLLVHCPPNGILLSEDTKTLLAFCDFLLLQPSRTVNVAGRTQNTFILLSSDLTEEANNATVDKTQAAVTIESSHASARTQSVSGGSLRDTASKSRRADQLSASREGSTSASAAPSTLVSDRLAKLRRLPNRPTGGTGSRETDPGRRQTASSRVRHAIEELQVVWLSGNITLDGELIQFGNGGSGPNGFDSAAQNSNSGGFLPGLLASQSLNTSHSPRRRLDIAEFLRTCAVPFQRRIGLIGLDPKPLLPTPRGGNQPRRQLVTITDHTGSPAPVASRTNFKAVTFSQSQSQFFGSAGTNSSSNPIQIVVDLTPRFQNRIVQFLTGSAFKAPETEFLYYKSIRKFRWRLGYIGTAAVSTFASLVLTCVIIIDAPQLDGPGIWLMLLSTIAMLATMAAANGIATLRPQRAIAIGLSISTFFIGGALIKHSLVLNSLPALRVAFSTLWLPFAAFFWNPVLILFLDTLLIHTPVATLQYWLADAATTTIIVRQLMYWGFLGPIGLLIFFYVVVAQAKLRRAFAASVRELFLLRKAEAELRIAEMLIANVFPPHAAGDVVLSASKTETLPSALLYQNSVEAGQTLISQFSILGTVDDPLSQPGSPTSAQVVSNGAWKRHLHNPIKLRYAGHRNTIVIHVFQAPSSIHRSGDGAGGDNTSTNSDPRHTAERSCGSPLIPGLAPGMRGARTSMQGREGPAEASDSQPIPMVAMGSYSFVSTSDNSAAYSDPMAGNYSKLIGLVQEKCGGLPCPFTVVDSYGSMTVFAGPLVPSYSRMSMFVASLQAIEFSLKLFKVCRCRVSITVGNVQETVMGLNRPQYRLCGQPVFLGAKMLDLFPPTPDGSLMVTSAGMAKVLKNGKKMKLKIQSSPRLEHLATTVHFSPPVSKFVAGCSIRGVRVLHEALAGLEEVAPTTTAFLSFPTRAVHRRSSAAFVNGGKFPAKDSKPSPFSNSREGSQSPTRMAEGGSLIQQQNSRDSSGNDDAMFVPTLNPPPQAIARPRLPPRRKSQQAASAREIPDSESDEDHLITFVSPTSNDLLMMPLASSEGHTQPILEGQGIQTSGMQANTHSGGRESPSVLTGTPSNRKRSDVFDSEPLVSRKNTLPGPSSPANSGGATGYEAQELARATESPPAPRASNTSEPTFMVTLIQDGSEAETTRRADGPIGAEGSGHSSIPARNLSGDSYGSSALVAPSTATSAALDLVLQCVRESPNDEETPLSGDLSPPAAVVFLGEHPAGQNPSAPLHVALGRSSPSSPRSGQRRPLANLTPSSSLRRRQSRPGSAASQRSGIVETLEARSEHNESARGSLDGSDTDGEDSAVHDGDGESDGSRVVSD